MMLKLRLVYLWMDLTFNLFLSIFITFVIGCILRFDRVIFGYFQTLMSSHATIADQLGTINTEAGRWKVIVSTFRNFLGRTGRRSTSTRDIFTLDEVQQLYEEVVVDDVV